MTHVVTKVVVSLIVVASSWSCAGSPHEESRGRSIRLSAADTLEKAIELTMADARRAVSEHGLTEAAMQRIEEALGS